MKEAFEIFIIRFCFAGLGATALIAFVLATYPTVNERVGKPLRKAVRTRRISALIPVVCVCGMILFATDKGIVPMSEPRTQVQMAKNVPAPQVQRVVESPAFDDLFASDEVVGRVLIGPWHRHGGDDMGFIVGLPSGWRFPEGTNHLAYVEIWSSGSLFASTKSPEPFVRLSRPLSLRPGESRVCYGMTTNNSFRVEWYDGHPNGSWDERIDASIELQRNGDIEVIEDGKVIYISRRLPFAHDGFGQDDDWVRANFTNAEEIISVGYSNWVDAQVGVGLTNGLYKFTASFVEDPPEATEFHIGDYSVCVTNAGEYVFLLEKGTEYKFNAWPFNDGIDYSVRDDLADDAQIVPQWSDWSAPGQWSVDGGRLDFTLPCMDYEGRCRFLPTFRGSPDIDGRLGGDDFPKLFTAVLTDCGSSCSVNYHWTTGDENLSIASPHAQSTLVSARTIPDWKNFDLSVTAIVGGIEMYSSIQELIYGSAEERPASLDIASLEILDAAGSHIRWGDVVLAGEGIRIKVGLATACESAEAFVERYSECILLRSFSVDEAGTNEIAVSAVSLSENGVEKLADDEFLVSVPASWLQETQLISKDEDGGQEKTSIDNSAATTGDDQRTDSDLIDALPGVLRGRVRGAGNESAAIPEGMFNARSLKAAGFAQLMAVCRDVRSSPKPVQQQADFVYYSGHGAHRGGILAGCKPSDLALHWNDVDTVVIAGCAVLDIGEYRANSFNPKGKWKWRQAGGACNPGASWEALGLDVYLGYAWYAPLDSKGGIAIAERFKRNLEAGQDLVVAWKNANDCEEGRNACAIDCRTSPHTYWYWSESLFGSPTWTSVQKGSSGW